MSPHVLSLTALEGLPEIVPGMDLAPLLAAALERQGLEAGDEDVLLVCQKIVSKSEGRFVELDAVPVSERARELAARCGKDPRLVEVILRESTEVVRCAPQVLIVRHRLGLVVANAGVDQSNVPDCDSRVLLLPRDPDGSARALRTALSGLLGAAPAVLITDSFGRPWRQGVCGTAIGAAGIVTLLDRRGDEDRCRRKLKVTQTAVADQLAAAASLLMGEGAEGRPAVLARGTPSAWRRDGARAADLLRPLDEDLFR
ncbi:MAG TPA: coenzyme F420-0:L-glutamate ligase [Steroidobacteraceae bacterium]|nr:coenzyme F420-0:L-glutamate ligase [Steroidobacteraceae bacterium]